VADLISVNQEHAAANDYTVVATLRAAA